MAHKAAPFAPVGAPVAPRQNVPMVELGRPAAASPASAKAVAPQPAATKPQSQDEIVRFQESEFWRRAEEEAWSAEFRAMLTEYLKLRSSARSITNFKFSGGIAAEIAAVRLAFEVDQVVALPHPRTLASVIALWYSYFYLHAFTSIPWTIAAATATKTRTVCYPLYWPIFFLHYLLTFLICGVLCMVAFIPMVAIVGFLFCWCQFFCSPPPKTKLILMGIFLDAEGPHKRSYVVPNLPGVPSVPTYERVFLVHGVVPLARVARRMIEQRQPYDNSTLRKKATVKFANDEQRANVYLARAAELQFTPYEIAHLQEYLKVRSECRFKSSLNFHNIDIEIRMVQIILRAPVGATAANDAVFEMLLTFFGWILFDWWNCEIDRLSSSTCGYITLLILRIFLAVILFPAIILYQLVFFLCVLIPYLLPPVPCCIYMAWNKGHPMVVSEVVTTETVYVANGALVSSYQVPKDINLFRVGTPIYHGFCSYESDRRRLNQGVIRLARIAKSRLLARPDYQQLVPTGHSLVPPAFPSAIVQGLNQVLLKSKDVNEIEKALADLQEIERAQTADRLQSLQSQQQPITTQPVAYAAPTQATPATPEAIMWNQAPSKAQMVPTQSPISPQVAMSAVAPRQPTVIQLPASALVDDDDDSPWAVHGDMNV